LRRIYVAGSGQVKKRRQLPAGRRRPRCCWRGGRRCRGRLLLLRGRALLRHRLLPRLWRCRAPPGRRRRRGIGLEFHKNGVGHHAWRRGGTRVRVNSFRGCGDPNRNRLGLVAIQPERHGEFGACDGQRAWRSAGLSGGGACFGARGFRLKLHRGGRRPEARDRKAWHAEAGASSQAQAADCDGDGSVHSRIRLFAAAPSGAHRAPRRMDRG
jgi:hypothetical protein